MGPQHPRFIALPLSCRRTGEQPSDAPAGAPNLPSIPGPRKGLHGPFLARASPQGEAESVPPSRSPSPQLAHGPGEGGKEGGRTNPNQLKTEPATRHLGSTNQLVALWIYGQRVGFRFSNTREEPMTMPWRWRGRTGRRGGAGARETEMAAKGKRVSCVARESFPQTDSMLQGPQPHASNTTPR